MIRGKRDVPLGLDDGGGGEEEEEEEEPEHRETAVCLVFIDRLVHMATIYIIQLHRKSSFDK